MTAAPEFNGRTLLLVPSNPTPNGDLHVGHLAGPFVAADVCRRAARLRGTRAHLLLGTAWHESQVALKARRLGLAAHDVAARHTAEIRETFAAAGIEPDALVEPTADAEVAAVAREMFGALAERRQIVERTGTVQHCASCRRHLFGGFVTGRCPHCGTPGASGTDCEACARYHDDAELVDPTCVLCGAGAVQRSARRAYLPLEPLRGFFERYFGRVKASRALGRYLEAVLAEPLPTVAVTAGSERGIELPGTGFAGQSLVPSFTLAARFTVALRQLGPDGADGARVVLIFGFDNAFERAFLFPAALRGLTGPAPLPDTLLMSHFYRLEGKKFSTSRNHLVWARDLIAQSSADEVRYHVAATRPEECEADFSLRDFHDGRRRGFVQATRAWAGGVLDRAHRGFAGLVPAEARWDDESRAFYVDVHRLAAEAWAAYEPATFSCPAATRALGALVARGQSFARRVASRPDAPAELRATWTALELAAVRALALSAAPITPDLAAELLAALGENGPREQHWDGQVGWIPPGRRLATA